MLASSLTMLKFPYLNLEIHQKVGTFVMKGLTRDKDTSSDTALGKTSPGERHEESRTQSPLGRNYSFSLFLSLSVH